MKMKKYKGPIIFSVIGITVSIVLIIVGTMIGVDTPSSFLDLGTQGNFIELNAGDTIEFYVYEESRYTYRYDATDSSILIYTKELNQVVSEYEIQLTTNTQTVVTIENSLYTEVYRGFDEIYLITVSEDTLLSFNPVLISGDEEIEPDIAIYNLSASDPGLGIFITGLVILIVVFIGGLIWFLVVMSHNNKVKAQFPKKVVNTYSHNEVEVLLNVDRQFSKDVQEGKLDAWMFYMHPNSIMGTSADNPFINGYDNIAESMAELFKLDNLEFKWKPIYAFLSDDGSLGVTIGLYKRKFIKDGEEISVRGKYMSVWRKVEGQWRVIFDMGN